MLETAEDLRQLQRLLDASAAAAGAHLRGIITDERRIDAAELCRRLTGMRLLVVATVTADGRPLGGPMDGYLLHGAWWFSTGPRSVRLRHLARRPAVTATHLPGEELAVSVHGTAGVVPLAEASGGELRQAMLDHYLPRQGEAFERWLEGSDALAVRIDAARMFTFGLDREPTT